MWQSALEVRERITARAPAVPVALAALLGILADSLWSPALTVWWLLLACAVAASVVWRRTPHRAVLSLMTGCAAAFGAWHQLSRTVPADAERLLAGRVSRPVQMEGRVIRPGWIHERPHNHTLSTVSVLDDLWLVDGTHRRTRFAGRVRLQLDDNRCDFPAGMRVRLVGRLSLPATAGNPDGFDFRAWLLRQQVAAVLRVDHLAAIETLEFHPSWSDRMQNQRRMLRDAAVARLQQSTSPETAHVAEALLLGSRQQLPDELRQAFMESGTLHVLAISGVNVGVIWLGLMRGCRTLGWSMRHTGWTTIGGLLAYVWLTDANPPIVRAATVALVLQSAELLQRQVSSLQALSLALLVLLIAQPQDLFHPGAQLSFLSVSALSNVQHWWDRHQERLALQGERQPPPASRRFDSQFSVWHPLRSWFVLANLSTGAVWAVTLPLVAWRFHLVSFAGFFLNVVLGPLVCVLLWSGYLWLVCAALSPLLSELPLRVFEASLVGLIWLTKQAAGLRASHLYVAGPPEWWVLGYYLALAWGALVARGQERLRVGHGLLWWMNLGLAWTLIVPGRPPGLVCEVLSVGHGLAVVAHCPNGRVLVYDAGSLMGPEVAAEAVCGSLWRHGERRIDALVVSHADADHCNAVPLVAERSSAGVLVAHRTFLDFAQDAVTHAVESWSAEGGGIRLAAAGDQIVLDPEVRMTVLHPPADFASALDNPNSLVLLLEYAGRRILLTGDLERDGLSALLAQPRRPVDLMLAPHHGSKAANPPALGAWSHPAWVVVSATDRLAGERIADHFEPPVAVLNTAVTGMIRCEIRPDGALSVSTFR